jgi:uncharacterized protein YecE (DUF72 family)
MHAMGDKLFTTLWVISASVKKSNHYESRLYNFCDALKKSLPNAAFEFRDDSWCKDAETATNLMKYGYELVRSDHPKFDTIMMDRPRGSYDYYRMHGTQSPGYGTYSDGEITTLAMMMQSNSRSVCIFNNTTDVSAPFDAQRLANQLEHYRS